MTRLLSLKKEEGHTLSIPTVNKANLSKGFVALITVIIISLILIVVSVALSESAFLTRGIVADSEHKERSVGIAEACIDLVRLKLIDDPGYGGGETVPIGSQSCIIRPILPSGGQNTIEVKVVVRESVTNLRVVINSSTHAVIDWDEVASF